jgi:hypothetical protein
MLSILRFSKILLALILFGVPAYADVYPAPQPVVQYAIRASLIAGSYTFTFSTYNSPPVCLVNGEASLVNILQVTPSVSSCIITSSSIIDTQTVDIVVIGNPN